MSSFQTAAVVQGGSAIQVQTHRQRRILSSTYNSLTILTDSLCFILIWFFMQTVGDNPVTAYRQLVQQYAKDLNGKAVDPKVATAEATAVFKKSPIAASMSGLWPRLIGTSLWQHDRD